MSDWLFRMPSALAATGDPGRPACETAKATTHLFDVDDPESSSRALWSERGIAIID
ncbi:hypothetical protein ACFXJ8_07540 [Nonomuraea sp. NPDC059194]|uniref:hypothetical protein n=1 Tax=Nonomuraea sp. NPDC059194 TaxID=3346764 RepID=UPI0036B3B883